MEKAKKILPIIGVFSVILIFWVFDARSDYTWSQTIIKAKTKDGWVVGATQANVIDPIHPWTMFKQPIVRIAFVKPSEFIKLDNELVFAKSLWVDYANMSRTEEQIFQNIYDCKNNKTAFIESMVSFDQINYEKLEWQDNVNNSNVDIAKVVCK